MDGGESSKQKENFIFRILRGLRPKNKLELEEVIKQAQEHDVIDENTEDMLKGVFDISRLRVGDIMVPRPSMITIDKESTLENAVAIIAKYGHSRYPVTCEDKDHIAGILMAKDLLPYALSGQNHKDLSSLLRPPVIVPESKRVDSMLKDFQSKRNHLAVVVDEFGSVCGLVTIEDVLELIVGDIGDEYDTVEPEQHNIRKTAENCYVVRGATLIEEFEGYFKCSMPEADVDTIAGLVIHAFGHLPKNDEVVTINQFTFKVLSSSKTRVNSIQVSINEDQDKVNVE
ncbi:HlyC/CorC family transporter [Anaerobiospirillum thomasii]|uniref:Magnesium and cobalt efflux protein CorC n=1 Tax=Anaerobiospirillum thomasii TaxID=179995 RepID=A0A2X0V5I6_9GAMM|nr:transporter associated domain-containing protein [Anaerobiospirillum thomasii]SPT69764.1 Magnesium and cobalt efflux protein CorC [Anaerobiospirillum thomasii]